jgi:cysteinyl-tRNA synthetase
VLDYQPTSLQEAAAAVERIDGFLAKAASKFGSDFGVVVGSWQPDEVSGSFDAFTAAMDDDLNIPRALAALHQVVRVGNTALAAGDDITAQAARGSVVAMTEILGLNAVSQPAAAEAKEQFALDTLVKAQLAARAEARAGKDWASSDAIRDTLAAAGVVVEDGPDGASWSLKRG